MTAIFVNDNYEGNGTLYLENGEYYIGQFKMMKNMEKEYYSIRIIILNMREILLMVKEKEKGNIFMKKVIITMDIG